MSKTCSWNLFAVALCVLIINMTQNNAKLYAQTSRSLVLPDSSPRQLALVAPKTTKQIITVGGPKADVTGFTSQAVQIAVDALRATSGTVRLEPGTYQIMAPVRLTSGISLIGAGKKTVLHKVDGYSSPFIIDADYGMLKLTVQDTAGFRPGMAVMTYDNRNNGGWAVTTAKITAIENNVLYIDNYLVRDYRSDRQGMVSNACSLVEAVEAENVRIADFVVDGNKAKNAEQLNGCRGGGVYLHKAKNCLVEGVEVKNFNGDGISWQITEDITVRNCVVHHCTNLGFHPGTGSDKTTIEACTSHHNQGDGIFLCWRVQNGIFRNNTVYGNDRYGISIGHKDTDNLFEKNRVYENGRHGVYFRNENEQNGGNRNNFHNNVIENNGTQKAGYGFYIDGITRDIVIENNTIRDTGKAAQKGGIYIGKRASNIKVDKNQMAGHTQGNIIDDSGNQ
ncbi:MAG: right-handed parallel beta-helix repeat-containing protein [Planctomycetota bacterium]|jgi:parallel beta-helix repeat protein